MRQAFINDKQVAFFETDTELVEWAEFVLKTAKENGGIFNDGEIAYNDDEDTLKINTLGGQLIVECNDLNEDGKLNTMQ